MRGGQQLGSRAECFGARVFYDFKQSDIIIKRALRALINSKVAKASPYLVTGRNELFDCT